MSNINELLYMARMKDEAAVRILMDELKMQIRYDVTDIINIYGPLRCYEEDFMQEANLCFYVAMETFREDRNCSFPSYLTIIVKRRTWALVRKLSHSHCCGFNQTVALDHQYAEGESLLNLIENRDAMSNPEYYLHYTLALESLEGLMGALTERDGIICESWSQGEQYDISRKKLGLSYKQYEGRLRRLKHRVREVVYAA